MAQRPQTHQPLPDPTAVSAAERCVNFSQPSPPLRVLVVDDNPTNRKLLKLLLQAEGHSIVEADNGISALERLDREPLDAVISDILMPEMDGYRLCHEIRKSPKFNRIPFIVYTASYTLPSDEKLALQFGVDKFIRKPAADDEIVNGLNEVLASAGQRNQKAVEQPAEVEVMREYSQALVRKLEQTVTDLSDANRKLAERTALAEFVATVNTVISQRAVLKEMLRLCCDAMVEHLGSAFARIWTLNEKEQVLEVQASSGMYTHIDGGHARIPVGQFTIGLIASEGKPHLTNAVIGDPRVNDQEWAKREGMTAFAGYPLMIADQLVGVMATFARKPFSQNALDAMGSVAQSIALGIRQQITEGELSQSEERFRELAENVNEIFFITDPQGKQVYYISPAHEQITGQKCAAVYQNFDAWLEPIHPDDRERIENAWRINLASFDEEYHVVRPDGGLRWLRSRSFPVKDEHGAIARVVGIATDITEQKQAHAKLNQNLDRIRALHDIDLAITSTLDLSTILKVLLAKIENLFPYPTVTAVRLLNQTTGELESLACHNMDLDDWKSSFVAERGGRAYQVIKGRVPLIVRNVLTHSDTVNPGLFQKYGLVSYIGLPLIAKDEALGVLNFYTKQDHEFSPEEIEFLMTLASRAAIAIHNAQLHEQTQRDFERIRAILDTALDCIITMDCEGKIIEFNPAAEKTFHYTRAEVVGKELVELIIPPSFREKHRRGLARYLATGDGPVLGRRIEVPAMRADGSEFPVELIISSSSTFGAPTFTGFIRDVSERKQAEEQSRRNLERIEALREIDKAITSTLDLQAVLDILLEKIDIFLPFPAATTIRLFNPVAGRFVNTACRNLDEQEWRPGSGRGTGQLSSEFLKANGPVITPDIQSDPEKKNTDFFRKRGFVSYLGVPLIAKGNTVGILGFYTKSFHEFTQQEIDFLATLAGQAAIAIHNAQLHEQTQQHLKRIEGVSEINNAIASTLSLKNVLEVLLEQIDQFCPMTVACGVRLFDEATGKLVPLAARHIPVEEWRQEIASAKGRLTQLLIETKKPVAILNMHIDSRTWTNDFALRHGLISYLGVPLIVRGSFIGNLVIYTKQEHAFSTEEIEFFTNLGNQAAIAIHNARLYEETERRRREAEELARVARSFTETLDVTVVGDRIVTSMRELFNVRGSAIRLCQSDGSLRRLASSGEVFLQPSDGDSLPSGTGLMNRAITEGKAVWSSDTLNDPEIILTDPMRDYQLRSGNRSMVALPLRAHEKLIGALTLSDRTGRTYSDNETTLLQTFADQAALALENAQLFEKNELSRRELEAINSFLDKSLGQLSGLYTAITPLGVSESVGERISGIVNRLIEATGADAGSIRISDKRTNRFPVIGQMGYSQEFLNEAPPEQSRGAVWWVITHGEPIISADIASDTRLRRKAQLEMGFKSCAILPLHVHGAVGGVIQISSRKAAYFDEEQKKHLLAVARQISIALENRELFDNLQASRNELERANKVKDEFLSVMSHELRTPLSVVIGYSGMLREEQLGPLTKDQEQALEVIRRNSQELFSMIESIMDATKIEAGSMIAEMETVLPSQLLADLQLSYDFPNRKNIRFEWSFSEALPPLWTDLRKLRQILTNLINNAIKFTDEGRIVVSAKEKFENEAGGRWIDFRIADSGIGIPPEEREKIFERFHQVDGSGTRSFEGVGLGLYIVKSFSEMLGGRVSVESVVGQGSSFTVSFPLQFVPKSGVLPN